MSGGVDSSAAAALLVKQGYNCIGIFMKLWSEPNSSACQENKCCSADAFADARKVAHQLGFPIYTLNLSHEFKKIIVDDFLKQYQNGKTPNPCIRCNKFIKFDLLLKKAKGLGCNYLATGHYAKITNNKNHKLELQLPKDKHKDQTYFLYNLNQRNLKHLIFPLSNLEKTQTRRIAQDQGLAVYQKPESQEICFVPEKSHYSFLKKYLKLTPGKIVDEKGKVLGQHEGLALYTLGQRKGIKVGGIGPYYVIRLDRKRNNLVVSNQKNSQEIKTKIFKLANTNWISSQAPLANQKIKVKIRYQAAPVSAKIKNNLVTLAKAQRAVMPGQSAVFYQGQRVLGGGIINKIIK